MDSFDCNLLVLNFVNCGEYMAISTAADTLLHIISVIHCDQTVLALELSFALDPRSNRPNNIWIAAFAHKFRLLLWLFCFLVLVIVFFSFRRWLFFRGSIVNTFLGCSILSRLVLRSVELLLLPHLSIHCLLLGHKLLMVHCHSGLSTLLHVRVHAYKALVDAHLLVLLVVLSEQLLLLLRRESAPHHHLLVRGHHCLLFLTAELLASVHIELAVRIRRFVWFLLLPDVCVSLH